MRRFVAAGSGCLVVSLGFNAQAQLDLGAPVESACPLAPSDYGTPVRRLFTASDGTELSFTLTIPSDFDPSVPRGVALYFHGNSPDPDGTYYPEAQVPRNAESRGLIIGAVRSPTTAAFTDGIARNWRNKDDLYVEELLASNFGGCLKLDKRRVYLVGGSNGTCFVSRMLTSFLWRDYAGGVLGFCGCWPPQTPYVYPVDAGKLRNAFRVFVQNTTGGFEYWNGPNGYEHFHYNLGLEVRTDLLRSGGHCENNDVNAEAALDWVLGVGEYAPEFAFVPYWEQVDLSFNYVDSLIALNDDGRSVLVLWEPHLTAAEWEQIGEKVRESDADLAPFYEWRDATFPEFQDLKPRVFTSNDYGTTWQGGETLDTVVHDVLAGADGLFYLATENGIWRDAGAGTDFAPFTLDEERVDAIEQSEDGTFFVYGAELLSVRRSKDGGNTWEELNAATSSGYLYRQRRMLSYSQGMLTMVQPDSTVLYSEDGGDSWQTSPVPNEPIEFVHHGRTFYSIDPLGEEFLKSTDAGATWLALTMPDSFVDAYMVVTPDGDLLIQGSDTGYRTKDGGATFQREAGLNLLKGMDAAFISDGRAIAVGARGVFRYQTDPSSLPDTSGLPTPPPATSSSDPASSIAPMTATLAPTVPQAPPTMALTPGATSTSPTSVGGSSGLDPAPTEALAPVVLTPSAATAAPISPVAMPSASSPVAAMATDAPTAIAGAPGVMPAESPTEGGGCGLGKPAAGQGLSSFGAMLALFGLALRRRS